MQARKEALARVGQQLKWSLLCAPVLALLTGLRNFADADYRQPSQVWTWSLAAQLALYLYWALLTPVVLHVMDWIRRTGRSRSQALGIHTGLLALLGCGFFGFAGVVNATVPAMARMTWNGGALLQPRTFLFLLANSALKYYLPIVLAGAVYAYYRRIREQELKTSELNRQLRESQFLLLKMQLHPHFLFNALHSISTLVYTNPEQADRMIAQLSDLLRLSLETTDVFMVPLEEELRYVTKYLELERIRFSDRLQVEVGVEPGALSVDVPNLILQPLVENAIKHGISRTAEGGRIAIRAWKKRGGLVIAVDDNGPGCAQPGKPPGLGTRNVRERLVRLYPHGARFEIKALQPRGTRQQLFIPLDDVSAFFETLAVESGALS